MRFLIQKPQNGKDFTRFGTYCGNSGNTIDICCSLTEKKLNEEEAPAQPKETCFHHYPNQ